MILVSWCLTAGKCAIYPEFIFKAVVTVNLTALLVLVTLFISVSQSLPQTAYVKMVDVWLIFSMFVPFVEVLVHTWIDMLRTEGEEGREVNHHGKTITVGGDQDTMVEDLDSEKKLFTDRKSADILDKKQDAEAAGIVSKWKATAMVQVDEKKMVKARKDFYDNAVSKHENMVKRLKFVSKCPKIFFYNVSFCFLSAVCDPRFHSRLHLPLLELRPAPLLPIANSDILPKPKQNFYCKYMLKLIKND